MSYIQSKEHREKITLSRKKSGWFHNPEKTKLKMSLSHKGENHHFFGKEFTDVHKKKISKAAEGRKPSHFKGGAMIFWKKRALLRDDYTCQVCGLREVEIMEVDHILPKSAGPELAFTLDNLITLCPNDHRRKTNSDRKRYRWRQGWKDIPISS